MLVVLCYKFRCNEVKMGILYSKAVFSATGVSAHVLNLLNFNVIGYLFTGLYIGHISSWINSIHTGLYINWAHKIYNVLTFPSGVCPSFHQSICF